ncbi:hypothetical protein BDD12DRAFT_877945 [Trichophaea hybrida]|nr:hypothetical protein BDD12DRAFT_877945 [Trichophaea hybrida]
MYMSDPHWLSLDLVASMEKLISAAALIYPTKNESEIDTKHSKTCAIAMVGDWSYLEKEGNIEEENIKEREIGPEKEIGKGKIYKQEEYCFEDDIEFKAELENSNTREGEEKKPSIKEVDDNIFTGEPTANKMIEVKK